MRSDCVLCFQPPGPRPLLPESLSFVISSPCPPACWDPSELLAGPLLPAPGPCCLCHLAEPTLFPFSQNLLWAGSALLAPETEDLWAALGQRAPGGSPGSAGLVQHLEEYAATLARNMELTYLNPVGLVTPNISAWWGRAGTWRPEGEGLLMAPVVAGGCATTSSLAGACSALLARMIWAVGLGYRLGA